MVLVLAGCRAERGLLRVLSNWTPRRPLGFVWFYMYIYLYRACHGVFFSLGSFFYGGERDRVQKTRNQKNIKYKKHPETRSSHRRCIIVT